VQGFAEVGLAAPTLLEGDSRPKLRASVTFAGSDDKPVNFGLLMSGGTRCDI